MSEESTEVATPADTTTPIEVGGGNEEHRATIPAIATETPTAETTPELKFESFDEVVPEEFKGKPYLKGVDSFDKLFKKLDGAQSLIGEKQDAFIPGESATDDERNAFLTKLGRPESAEGYSFNHPAGAEVNDALDKGLRDIFFDEGLTATQATNIEERYTKLVGEIAGNTESAAAKADTDFDALAKETFGDRQERVMDIGNVLLKDHTPENMKEHLADVPNEYLILFAGVLDNLAKTYIGEDRIQVGDGTGFVKSNDDIREAAQKLMDHPAYKDPWHKEHKAKVDEVNKMYKTLRY